MSIAIKYPIKSSKIYSCLFVSITNLFHQQNFQLLHIPLKSVTHFILNLNLRLAEKEFLSIILLEKLKMSVQSTFSLDDFVDCQVHGLNTPASRGGLKQGDVLVSLRTSKLSLRYHYIIWFPR